MKITNLFKYLKGRKYCQIPKNVRIYLKVAVIIPLLKMIRWNPQCRKALPRKMKCRSRRDLGKSFQSSTTLDMLVSNAPMYPMTFCSLYEEIFINGYSITPNIILYWFNLWTFCVFFHGCWKLTIVREDTVYEIRCYRRTKKLYQVSLSYEQKQQ